MDHDGGKKSLKQPKSKSRRWIRRVSQSNRNKWKSRRNTRTKSKGNRDRFLSHMWN